MAQELIFGSVAGSKDDQAVLFRTATELTRYWDRHQSKRFPAFFTTSSLDFTYLRENGKYPLFAINVEEKASDSSHIEKDDITSILARKLADNHFLELGQTRRGWWSRYPKPRHWDELSHRARYFWQIRADGLVNTLDRLNYRVEPRYTQSREMLPTIYDDSILNELLPEGMTSCSLTAFDHLAIECECNFWPQALMDVGFEVNKVDSVNCDVELDSYLQAAV